MQILDILRQAQDGLAIENLAAAFNVDARATDAALASVVPEMAERLERITLSRGGLAELVRALGDPRHRRALVDPSVFVDPAVGEDGARVLGHIFPTPDAIRASATRAVQQSGLEPVVIQRMLPFIAAFTMSGIAKALLDGLGAAQGRIPGMEGRPGQDDGRSMEQPPRQGGGSFLPLPGGGRRRDEAYIPGPRPEGRGMGMPGGMPGPRGGLPGGGSFDPAGQSGGYPLPDVQGMPMPGPMPEAGSGGGGGGSMLPGPIDAARGGRGGQPMPMPGPGPDARGGQNPLDDLSDILRRRGATSSDGSPLGGIIRSILGSVLGFRSGGIMSWLIRLIVVRFGWGILRRVLGRMITGRS